MGRPKLPDSQRRQRYEVWMTPETKRRLDRLVWAYGLKHTNDAIELAARLTSPLRSEEDEVMGRSTP